MNRSCQRLLAAARTTIAAAFSVLAACGLSHAPATTPPAYLPFELRVREARSQTIYRAAEDSMAAGRFESSLVCFGRIEPPGKGEAPVVTVYADSLEFASDLPFRFTTHIRRDTVLVTPEGGRLAAQTGMLESDRAMLACLFDGPALRVFLPAEAERDSTRIEDLKSGCAGGLYRRLDLAVALGAFVFGTPAIDENQDREWQTSRARPSFSGLGHLPHLRWSYRIAGAPDGSDDREASIEIACDTTLTGVRTRMPNGETADIIADRIRVRGSVRHCRGVPFFHRGTITIEENIRYVRPAIGTSVLDEKCSAEITFDRR